MGLSAGSCDRGETNGGATLEGFWKPLTEADIEWWLRS